MALTRTNVLHIAQLAKLTLEPSEADHLLADLDKILGYVELLNEVDTTSVPPMSHVTVGEAPLRQDVVNAVLTPEAVLAEAPRRTGNGFAVPAFVDEG